MINSKNVTLHTLTEGSGPAIILIHGFTTTSSFWKNQVAELAKFYRVVRFDLRGHGDSEKPENIPYTVDGFTQDLVSVLDALSIDRAAIFGLSMGGAVALRFALDYSDRVFALGLVDTTAHGVGPAVQADTVVSKIESMGIAAASEEIIVKSFSKGTAPDIVEWAKREVVKTPRYVAEPAIRSLAAFDVRSKLGCLRMPTLIIVGEDDEITPVASSEFLHSAIDNAVLHIVPQAGHFPMLEQPRKFNEIVLQFLNAVQNGTDA